MFSLLRTLFDDEAGNTEAKIIAIYAHCWRFNVGAWAWALISIPSLSGPAGDGLSCL